MVDRNALLRALAGKAPAQRSLTRKAKLDRQMSRMTGLITTGVMINDIDHGAWTFIGQPHSPDFREIKDYDFL